jgi:hypothetical protein
MRHLVYLLHHRGSQKLKLLHPMLLLFVLKMVCVSSVAAQVTVPKTAARVRISWHFLLLAVAMAVVTTRPTTIIPDLLLMVVDRLIMLILKKFRINLLL